jgi:hypothetical protein
LSGILVRRFESIGREMCHGLDVKALFQCAAFDRSKLLHPASLGGVSPARRRLAARNKGL